ncbi:VP1 [Rhynchobatus djiddensis polyomavirus 1]|uniref:VP1 n=1 Tax=Rhynchobatus djiddensis polyomavirus 1 TaxID=2170102 RepID=A0A0B5CSL6_9POLY|nr:VP1 [Rhynchobatus djiddensis polyomavirus 1]AJE25841.1 VP1 [Rhynchobatus djiddensis polyomavirus 1]
MATAKKRKVQKGPTLLKGGFELLDLVLSPDEKTTLDVEYYINPSDPEGDQPKWQSGTLKLDKIGRQESGDTFIVWECTHFTRYRYKMLGERNFVEEQGKGPAGTGLILSGKRPLFAKNESGKEKRIYDPKATLTPVSKNEEMAFGYDMFDPLRNSNYYYSLKIIETKNAPYINHDTNSTTTMVLDENGVGILCPGEMLFVSAMDYECFASSGKEKIQMFSSLFTFHFRMRRVRSKLLLQDMFLERFRKETISNEKDGEVDVILQIGNNEEGRIPELL